MHHNRAMRLAFIPITLLLFVVFVPMGVHAVTILNEDAETSIRENCIDAQQNMQKLQRADAVTRINRGNNYATMQKLMSAMSARSASNAYSVPGLTESTSEFTELRDSFIGQYTNYEIALRELIAMDCQRETVLFYNQLESVREQRNNLATTVEEMDQVAGKFEEAVLVLREEVKESASE